MKMSIAGSELMLRNLTVENERIRREEDPNLSCTENGHHL